MKTVMAHGMSFAPESWSEEDRKLWERPLDEPGPKPKFDLEQTILDRKLFNVAKLCLEHGLNLTFEHCCFNERTGIDTLEFLGGFSRSFKGFMVRRGLAGRCTPASVPRMCLMKL